MNKNQLTFVKSVITEQASLIQSHSDMWCCCLLFQQHIFTQTMATAHQWAALHYSCQHCCLLVLGLINPELGLCAPPSLRTRYCLLRLVSQSPCVCEVEPLFLQRRARTSVEHGGIDKPIE